MPDRQVRVRVVVPAEFVAAMPQYLGVTAISGKATNASYRVGAKKVPLTGLVLPRTQLPARDRSRSWPPAPPRASAQQPGHVRREGAAQLPAPRRQPGRRTDPRHPALLQPRLRRAQQARLDQGRRLAGQARRCALARAG